MKPAIWQSSEAPATSYCAPAVVYGFKLPATMTTGEVLLRTWVEVRYSSPLRMKTDGTIKGAAGYFFKVDSAISYQYEHGILER